MMHYRFFPRAVTQNFFLRCFCFFVNISRECSKPVGCSKKVAANCPVNPKKSSELGKKLCWKSYDNINVGFSMFLHVEKGGVFSSRASFVQKLVFCTLQKRYNFFVIPSSKIVPHRRFSIKVVLSKFFLIFDVFSSGGNS